MTFNFRFLEEAKEGDDIVIEAKAIKVGRKLCYLGCELRNKQSGSLYAKGYQSFYMTS